jgi:beta-phosphoglucomutase-like phosphatase (HAD superfamily)
VTVRSSSSSLSPMPVDLVIFDCDGVLVESEPLVNRLYVEMLAEEGFALDEAATLRELVGAALTTRVATMARRLGWTPRPSFEDDFLARLAVRVRAELRAADGVRDLLGRSASRRASRRTARTRRSDFASRRPVCASTSANVSSAPRTSPGRSPRPTSIA